MNTRKFKMFCDGQFVGFVFISDNYPNIPHFKIGIIWPFEKQGNWATGDLELIGRKHINDVFPVTATDDEVMEILISRTAVRNDCRTFTINLYE
jgi:hypothetical protein